MKKKRLFVYSVDALVKEDLDYLKTKPHFSRFLEDVSGCDTVESIYPTVTYPVHVSIQTGCYPDKTGVIYNNLFNTEASTVEWTWDSRLIQCENIFSAAKKAGYSTSAIAWPVTSYNPDIDWHVPEYWLAHPGETIESAFAERGANEEVVRLLRKNSCLLAPSHVLGGNDNFAAEPEFDNWAVQTLCDLIREHAPEVMFFHASLVDSLRHKYGIFNQHVTQTLDQTDQWLGQIIDAMKQAGVYEDTNIVILSDHGQMDVVRLIKPNALLAERGLIKVNEEGKVEDYTLYGMSNGMSMTFWLKDPGDKAAWELSYKTLCEMAEDGIYGFTQVFTREEVAQKYHLDGDFAFIVETDGYTSFKDGFTRPFVANYDFRDYRAGRATHGYLPEKGPQPVFLAKGPDIVPGVMLPRRPIVDEAPTFAKLLGFEMPDAQGTAMTELLK